MQALELGAGRTRGLHPVDEGLERLLLGVGVHEAPGGVAVLRLHHAPHRPLVPPEVTSSPHCIQILVDTHQSRHALDAL